MAGGRPRLLANGRIRHAREAAAALALLAALTVLAGACAVPDPSLPRWASAGPAQMLAGNDRISGAALAPGPALQAPAPEGAPASATPAPAAVNGDRPITPPPAPLVASS